MDTTMVTRRYDPPLEISPDDALAWVLDAATGVLVGIRKNGVLHRPRGD